jgi:regulator of replication initiation timing
MWFSANRELRRENVLLRANLGNALMTTQNLNKQNAILESEKLKLQEAIESERRTHAGFVDECKALRVDNENLRNKLADLEEATRIKNLVAGKVVE